ncbi:MAG TPA: 2-oxo-4-hydroxy-4-carboxy-5-ureidoimidazoline decarboxylase, partial [Steroidobacteraceae bacterium]
RAHPQLGARGRKRLELTEHSAHEQRRAGLDACTDDEFAQLLLLNTAYVEKFSFPFILAVRGHDPDSILGSMSSRLNNDVELERHTALTQIGLIGGYRLADLVTSPAGAEVDAMRERLVSSATAPSAVTTLAAAALLREWMLAANLDVYPGAAGNLAGVQQTDPSVPCLLIGLYSDSTDEVLRRDGGLGSLLGIAVAQPIRQKRLATHFGLLVLASPADERHDSIFLDAHPGAIRNAPVLTVTETDPSSSPLRAAGVSRCIVLVHEGLAGPNAGGTGTSTPASSLDSRTLDHAARSLEEFLTQPGKIQE